MIEEQLADQLFDFDALRRIAIDEYQQVRPRYESFATVVKNVLVEAVRNAQIKIAAVEARAKTLDSFGDKAATPMESNPDQPKYPNPLADIEDLAAARVITFFLKDIQSVNDIVQNEFQILERSDKSEPLLRDARVGYQSIHYLVELKPNRTSLPEYAQHAGLRAEIQLRTVLQHAWAEIEHDIQYKSIEAIPADIRRRFTSLAGLLEIADREFQAVQAEDERVRQEARRSVEQGKLEQVEITGDALRTYLDGNLGPDGRMTTWSYEWTARLLRRMGFSDFRQIDQSIAPYDHDAVSRTIHGSRQGQLSRFEDVMLVSMGEKFIDRHYLAGEPLWREWKKKTLERVRQEGLIIGSYTPDSEIDSDSNV